MHDRGMQASSWVEIVPELSTDRFGQVLLNDSNRSTVYRWVAEAFQPCLDRIGVPSGEDVLSEEVRVFHEQVFPAMPQGLKRARGSTGPLGLLALWLLARTLRPRCLIESGVNVGASLSILRAACPTSMCFAFDIDLSKLAWSPTGVYLVESDLNEYDFGDTDLSETLAFFDDHIDSARRIREAAALGIPYVVIDDTPHVGKLYRFRYPAVPTVPMILDERLAHGTRFEWWHRGSGSCLRYNVDAQAIAAARQNVTAAVSLDVWRDLLGGTTGSKWLLRLN